MDNMNTALLQDLAQIIKQGKKRVAVQVNSTLTLVYWQVGHRINTAILGNQRAEYAKEIVPKLAAELTELFGRSFASKNLRRMMQFAKEFEDIAIVVTLARQLQHLKLTKQLTSIEAKCFVSSLVR